MGLYYAMKGEFYDYEDRSNIPSFQLYNEHLGFR